MYGVYTVFLAGKSPYIRSNTVCIYGSGQPYSLHMCMYTVVELQVCRVRKEATRMGCKSPRSLHRNRKVPNWYPTTGTGLILLA